ncbi:ABC-type transporter, integral membrane subunit [Caldalkalibacillus thermarum TA2.A1]|uniref:ABC-type transporter, integral membrane subunit n=1 Tax=Caldalkalibacillus thermarum (strain TA2.A1) TaxID=986075 RepID=F5L6T0_CALTT|nr:branched-chain amino acid ABC transporter permease [Caldalkalibacillus thermarum]EGL82973.1 ABC-type transporter, integral membrane subunit [Caldalkalibacillus thermarum TA2.A1]QZT33588.1 branched-chain amino acid ABC transporter permease [Caldalkalibacillus thermarum TA2.A1]
MVADIMINTLINGGVYALLAIGFSLIFGVARIVNLTHTAFYMFAAYLIFAFTQIMGWPMMLSMIAAMLLTVLAGVLLFKWFVEPVQEHETTVLIVTVALALVIQELVLLNFGGRFRTLPSLIPGYVTVAGVRVSYQHLLTLGVVALTLSGLWLFLMKSKFGIAMRAIAQDREVANLMGIHVRRVSVLVVAMTVFLAALAGILVAPIYILEPHMWMHPLVIVLAAVVLGGLGSLKGSVIGAFILALAETFIVFVLPAGAFLKGAFSLIVLVLVLLIRPEGLYGISFEGER